MLDTFLPQLGIKQPQINLLKFAPKICYNLPRGHDDFIWHLAKRSP